MKAAFVDPPVPSGALVHRDLFAMNALNDVLGEGGAAGFFGYLKNRGTAMPVLPLLYSASVAREHGAKCAYFDLTTSCCRCRFGELVRFRPDLVLLATSLDLLPYELDFASKLRRLTGAKVILCGDSAAWFSSEILNSGKIDAVINGEPESLVAHLVGGETEKISGLILPGDDSTNVSPSMVEDLDSLVRPAWDLVNFGDYGYFPLIPGRPFATVQASRGCSYGCGFCPYFTAQGKRFRPREVGRVVEELLWLKNNFGVRGVLFRDPCFSYDVHRTKKLCQEMISRDLGISWGCETRLDHIDGELMELMAAAGCRSVELGFDGPSDEVCGLNDRKRIKLEEYKEKVPALERLGIKAALLAVIGIEGEDRERMTKTLEALTNCSASYVNVQVAREFPYTKMFGKFGSERSMTDFYSSDAVRKRLIRERTARNLRERCLRRYYLNPSGVFARMKGGGFIAYSDFLARHAMAYVLRYAERSIGAEGTGDNSCL